MTRLATRLDRILASAFIVMFRRLTGMTPDEHRRTLTRAASAQVGHGATARAGLMA